MHEFILTSKSWSCRNSVELSFFPSSSRAAWSVPALSLTVTKFNFCLGTVQVKLQFNMDLISLIYHTHCSPTKIRSHNHVALKMPENRHKPFAFKLNSSLVRPWSPILNTSSFKCGYARKGKRYSSVCALPGCTPGHPTSPLLLQNVAWRGSRVPMALPTTNSRSFCYLLLALIGSKS